jgi:hypothetical protein
MTMGPPPIPVADAADIGARHGYDQVIVIARKVGQRGGEWVTAWGVNAENDAAAKLAAEFLKYRVMKWIPAFSPETIELLAKSTIVPQAE